MKRAVCMWGCGVLLLFTCSGLALAQTQALQPAPKELSDLLNCDDVNSGLCADLWNGQNYEGAYSGHDEPALLFYSHRRGSGNSSIYLLTLPNDPPKVPTQDGKGGTWNFQLHPAFWFGMAMCDTQSAPNFTTECEPDSDENIFDNPDPNADDYIGHHPGGAFMEMQFYPPGWIGTPGFINATQWLAALNIDSDGASQVTGKLNNAACLRSVGQETVNFATITRNGIPIFPPNPARLNFGANNPDFNNILTFNPGDTLLVILHDTPAGFEVIIKDITTGDSGKMVASGANGFGQVLFEPDATACSVVPYDFHPMYTTSSEHTRLTWTAHSFNVSFSDEIGHFEFCDAARTTRPFSCLVPGVEDTKVDADDTFCISPAEFGLPVPPFIGIMGCISTEFDFDGTPYGNNWPGTNPDPVQDQQFHAQPVRFTSPLFFGEEGLQNYRRVAFETDLPATEQQLATPCNTDTGQDCVNPPVPGAFYPFYTTIGGGEDSDDEDSACQWQLGGDFIPGTTRDFGGSSSAEYGDLLPLNFPVPGGSVLRFDDFRRTLNHNPCKVHVNHWLEEAIGSIVPFED
jgi:hypothetical protein